MYTSAFASLSPNVQKSDVHKKNENKYFYPLILTRG